MKRSTRISIVIAAAVLAGIVTFLLPPIPQAQEYHNFADQRDFFGIPHFLNVASNLAFIAVGGWGLWGLFRSGQARPVFLERREKGPWAILFGGALLTGIGSAYYHWAPGNETLLWDRLPMTLVTMSLLAAVISERMSVKAGLRWLVPLLLVGILSVVYWIWGESRGAGDLRLYGLVQFLPLVLIPLLILLFAPRYTGTGGYFIALGWYFLSRLAEAGDETIFAAGHIASGHTLKHLLAAAAVYSLYRMIARRDLEPSLRRATETPLKRTASSRQRDT